MIAAILGIAMVMVVAVAIVVWFDDPYTVEAWDEANPATAGRDLTVLPLLERHACPFADEPFADGVECATLVVPANRSSPDGGGTVDLAVAIIPASGGVSAADPILYLEGGPGGASVAWFDLWQTEGWPGDHDRDLILLDQRGSGYSTPSLGCGEVWDAAVGDELEANRRCRDRVLAAGAELAGVSTPEHAADVADLRLALGIEEWNLLGVSYGTRVALAVMDRYPEGVRSVVLDSVYPPEVDVLGDQGPAAVAAFDGLASACRRDAVCDAANGDLWAQLAAAAAALDADPLERLGEEWDGADLADALFFALYDTMLIEELPSIVSLAVTDPAAAFDALEGADDGGSAGGATRRGAMSLPRRGTVPAYEDSDGTFTVIECREEYVGRDLTAAREQTATLPAPFDVSLLRQLEHTLATCKIWGVEAAPVAERRAVVSDIPTLLLAGGLDPVTPPWWAERAAESLSGGHLVRFPSAGHALISAGACPVGLIEGFWSDPRAPIATDCTSSFDTPAFRHGR